MESRIMETGLYPNIDDATYHKLDHCSNSRLTKIYDRSPAHCKYYAEHPETTEAMEVGHALHAAILQPEVWASKFARRPDGLDLRRKEDKATFATFKEANTDKTILSCDNFDSIDEMADAVHSNIDARILLEAPGMFEASAIFDDRDIPGLRMKARFDKLSQELSVIVDVKTCVCAHPRVFEKDIYFRGYHRQAKIYKDAAEQLGIKIADFCFIAVEKEGYHGVAVYKIEPAALELAQKELYPLKATYRRCEQSGAWPGYAEGVVSIGCPDWCYNRVEVI